MIRFDFQGLFVLGDRFVHPLLLAKTVAKINECFFVVRIDFQRLLKMSSRLSYLSLFIEKFEAKVVVSHPGIRIESKISLPECFGVGIHPALLPRQHSQNQQQCHAQYWFKEWFFFSEKP